ncbi:Response regulator receiver domain-containing protein [Ohtaekwangia koreensis]|uniref:Response regulator receiver domain-containing protein n=1 Tax=Ohtaekwangia koreensis TaxID=688867 RepID=A0A1T5KPD1_9BACT|nr:Response regulator receiver domain-containing protein [Ohtaekwangia koreensis]
MADDDQDETDLFGEALRDIDQSLELYSAANGKEAISALYRGQVRPEIIFLDINMPEMNGWDCLTTLKSDATLREIPVVMYSTSSAGLDGKRAVQSGAICYLEKPPSFLKLKDFLEKISISSRTNLPATLRAIEANKSHRLVISD